MGTIPRVAWLADRKPTVNDRESLFLERPEPSGNVDHPGLQLSLSLFNTITTDRRAALLRGVIDWRDASRPVPGCPDVPGFVAGTSASAVARHLSEVRRRSRSSDPAGHEGRGREYPSARRVGGALASAGGKPRRRAILRDCRVPLPRIVQSADFRTQNQSGRDDTRDHG